MSLSAIYQELHRRARETGEDRGQTLTGGARIAVRVREGVVTLTISRAKKKVGSTELEVFKRECGVPSAAVRFPQEEQNTRTVGEVTWWYVAYRWMEDSE